MLKTRNKKNARATTHHFSPSHERWTRKNRNETHCERIYKTHLSPPLPVAFSSTEIRGGVLAATTMVRPAITIQQPVPIWILERYSSLRWYLVAGHVLHNARRLQGPAHTCSLRPTYISQRHGQLSYEVLFRLFLITFFYLHTCFSNSRTRLFSFPIICRSTLRDWKLGLTSQASSHPVLPG